MPVLNVKIEVSEDTKISMVHRLVQDMATGLNSRIYYARDGYVIRRRDPDILEQTENHNKERIPTLL